MCRSQSDPCGGRRCKVSQASIEAKRRKDRSSYALRKAQKLDSSPPAIQKPVEVADQDWSVARDEIVAERAAIAEQFRQIEAAKQIRAFKGEFGELHRKLMMDDDLRPDDALQQALTKAGVDIEPDQVHSVGLSRLMEDIEQRVTAVGHRMNAEIMQRLDAKPEQASVEDIAKAKEIYEVALAKRRELSDELAALAQTEASAEELTEIRRKVDEARDDVSTQRMHLSDLTDVSDEDRRWVKRHGEAARRVLAEVRDLGMPEGGLNEHPKSNRDHKDAMSSVAEAASFYPTDWLVDSSEAESPLFVRVTKGRAHYQDRESIKWDDPATTKTLKKKLDPIVTSLRKPYYTVAADWAEKWADNKMVGKKLRVGETYQSRGRLRKIVSYEVDPETGDVEATFDGGSKSVKISTVDDRTLPEYQNWQTISNLDFDDVKADLRHRSRQAYRNQEDVEGPDIDSISWTRDGMIEASLVDGTYERYATEFPFAGEKGSSTDRVSTLTTDLSLTTTIHELAHRFEHVRPGIVGVESAFWYRRCSDAETAEMLPGKAYHGKKNEVVYPDAGFVNAYSSKTYGSAYELLSMGCESIFAGKDGCLEGVGSLSGATDPDHKALTLGMLATL